MSTLNTQTVIQKLKAHFARYGIPELIYSDNGPQLVSKEFNDFCKKYEIKRETSSPGNSKANGAAEAAVKIAKKLMQRSLANNEDPYLALLCYRNIYQEETSCPPVQRLMVRRSEYLIYYLLLL